MARKTILICDRCSAQFDDDGVQPRPHRLFGVSVDITSAQPIFSYGKKVEVCEPCLVIIKAALEKAMEGIDDK